MFAAFVDEIRRIVRSENDAGKIGPAVAAALQPCLGRCDFLAADELEPGEMVYRQHILHVEPDGSFSIVALVWLPGQQTPVHDHVSWCVVGVHTGEEHETVYDLRGDGDDAHLVVSARGVNPACSVATLLPPGDIHRVENGGNGAAVSLHVYGADIRVLGSSIRRRYDLAIRG
ncbi:cysteine dioxygenase [soil metagenome]